MRTLRTLLLLLVALCSAPGVLVDSYRFTSGGNAADALNDASLQVYYKLDEASGAAAIDAKGGDDNLTDVLTVDTSATAKIGTARYFTSATGNYFTINDNARVSQLVFVAAWARLGTTLTAGMYPGIISKFAAGQNEFALYLNGDNQRFEFQVSGDGTAITTVTANNAGDPSDNAYHFVCAWLDTVAQTINIQVDNGAVDSVAHTTGIFDGNATLTVGAIGAGAFTWTGELEEIIGGKRIPTAGERAGLYNAAAGYRPAGL